MRLVNDIDHYLEAQVKKYDNAQSIRKTAREVADETRRRNDNG